MSRPPGNKCSRCQKPWHGPQCNAPYAAKRTRVRASSVVTEEQLDKMGRLVDRIDNLVHAGRLPLPDRIHVKALTEALPELHSELKTLYVAIAGDDPWADGSADVNKATR